MNKINVTKPLENIQIDMEALERLGLARERDPRVRRKLFSWKMFLLILLVLMLLSGFLTLVLSLVISVTSPFLGAMYSFFFSNIVGKQMSKAVFTSAVLCGILWLLEHYGLVVILITPAALLTYIPLALAMLALWYLIGHLL